VLPVCRRVGRLGHLGVFEAVGGRPDTDPGHADRRAPAPAPDQAADAIRAHQPPDALAPEPLTVGEDDLGVDARGSI
jgi:hypothetical protein